MKYVDKIILNTTMDISESLTDRTTEEPANLEGM